MKRYMSTVVSTVLVALVAVTAVSIPTDGAAQDTVWNRYTLEDLGGVFVRTEAATCESVGVTRRPRRRTRKPFSSSRRSICSRKARCSGTPRFPS